MRHHRVLELQGVGNIKNQQQVIASLLNKAEPQDVHHEIVVTGVGAALTTQKLLFFVLTDTL